MPNNLLPQGRHKPRSEMSASRHMIQGLPKVGKTTFANTWPNPLFLATEPGTHLMQAAEVEVRDWQTFLQVLDELELTEHSYQTIVLDTVDNLYSRCMEFVCESLNVAHVSDAPYKGWDILKSTWTAGIHRMASLQAKGERKLCPLFIGHTKLEPMKKKMHHNGGMKMVDTGMFIHRSNLPSSGRGILHSAVDFLYAVEVDEDGERWLITQPVETAHAKYEAGARGTPGRMLPERIPMNFVELRNAFETTFGDKK